MSHDDRPIILVVWAWCLFVGMCYSLYEGYYIAAICIAAFTWWMFGPWIRGKR